MARMITFVILLLAFSFCHTVLVESSLYGEIQNLNASCFPSDSCRSLRHLADDHMWGGRLCECGSQCVRFGTCCSDSVHSGKWPPQEHEHCQRVENFPVPVTMVAKCAEEWQWPADVIRKCENGEHTADDHLLWSVPMTDAETLTTYRNYFCALCNYGGGNFLYWNVFLRTNVPPEVQSKLKKDRAIDVEDHIVYDSSKKSWVVSDEHNNELYEVDVQYILPLYLRTTVKPCYENLMQICKASHSETELEKKCLSYYSPLKMKTGEGVSVYRNVHCALCNDVESSLIGKEGCAQHYRSSEERKRPMSFALLLDVNQSDGELVGMRRVPVPDCGKNRKYDPYFKKCRDLVCALPGYVVIDGRCVEQ